MKKHERNYARRGRSKAERQAWWRSLTAEEQADYRYEKIVQKKGSANWNQIYSDVLAQGLFMR